MDNRQTAWSIIKFNLARIPWRDFILGMFIPLLILEFVSVHSFPLLGVYLALAWLILVLAIFLIWKHILSIFPLITLIVTATNVAGRFLIPVHPVFKLVPSLDAMIIGLIFVGSMLTSRPFIMLLLGKDTIDRTKAKFGKSKFWYKAWFDVNIMWGMFYIIQGVISSYLMVLNVELGNIMGYVFGWPSVLVLLYISVDHPRRYWEKNRHEMQEEIQAAEMYEEKARAAQGRITPHHQPLPSE